MKLKKLYRPVNKKELELIIELNCQAFPERLPEQPIFYPVLNEEYAKEISIWNIDAYGEAYITEFFINDNYFNKFEIQNVGSEIHDEIWVPAEQLDEFNKNIVGKISYYKYDKTNKTL